MHSLDILMAFLAAAFVFAVMPGPALLYTAAQTLARGRLAGWRAVLGIHIGGWVHVVAAALGLALLFLAIPWLYAALKLAGAAYLCFLGARLIIGAGRDGVAFPSTTSPAPGSAFWQSVLVEVLNPKTALFFLAFLPQFTDPSASFPIWLQLLILGAVVNVMFSLADAATVVIAHQIRDRMQRAPGQAQWAQRIGGGILVALGLRLALDRG